MNAERMNAEEDGGRRRTLVAEAVAAEREQIPVPDEWNELTGRVIGCAMEVHSTLGPGLLERLYEEAMAYELKSLGLPFRRQVDVAVRYKGIALPTQRLDLVVDDLLVVELKAVADVSDTHLAQLVSYLRAADLPLGLVINFNARRLRDGVYRRLNERAVDRHGPSS